MSLVESDFYNNEANWGNEKHSKIGVHTSTAWMSVNSIENCLETAWKSAVGQHWPALKVQPVNVNHEKWSCRRQRHFYWPNVMHPPSRDWSTEIERVLLSDSCSTSKPPWLDYDQMSAVDVDHRSFLGWLQAALLITPSKFNRPHKINQQKSNITLKLSFACYWECE